LFPEHSAHPVVAMGAPFEKRFVTPSLGRRVVAFLE
jgi:hypothetical protein